MSRQPAATAPEDGQTVRSIPRRLASSLFYLLPEGRPLPTAVWRRRHRAIVVVIWLHAIGIACYGWLAGDGVAHGLAEGAAIATFGALADLRGRGRDFRAAMASLGLLTSSAMLVHLSGGYIEMHFHFFAALAILALYQEWPPFLLAIGYVLVEHGVVGVLEPSAVYNHPDAWARPWEWAAIHAAFVGAASVANLAAWRLNEHQALHDPLTNLANRILFGHRVDQALGRANGQASLLAVLFVDLDGFKTVNDSLGHQAGDEMLIAAARRFGPCLRRVDTIARHGGDEFVILLEDLPGAADAAQVADRIQESLREPFRLGELEVFTAASIGIALGTPGESDGDTLIRSADLAMYRAKSMGKARSEFFDVSMDTSALARLELHTDLRRAVERREFRVHYQPIVDLRSGEMAGVEALARWEHPQRGLIPPGQFIPLAEETGLILPIGRMVLEESCRQIRCWQEQLGGDRPLTLSVNLSAKQLEQPRLVEDIAETLHETGLEPPFLKIEITESVMMQDGEAPIRRLRKLKALGVRLAIDDFGTGYSSLAYPKRLPIDTLKIDRSFVDRVGQDADDTAIVRTIMALAKTLGLAVTGEGVETSDQLDTLRALGCDQAQGFLLARPMPADAVGALLAARRPLADVTSTSTSPPA